MAEMVIATRQAVSLNGFSANTNKAIPRKTGIKHEDRIRKRIWTMVPVGSKEKDGVWDVYNAVNIMVGNYLKNF